MPKTRPRVECRSCGYVSPRPLGRCPACAAWDSFAEAAPPPAVGPSRALPIAEVGVDRAPRLACGLAEVDRVLGGGLVAGSLVLLGGDPGVGKSTLLLQALDGLARRSRRPVLYATGEESAQQVGLRASRLGIDAAGLLLLAETRLDAVLDEARRIGPAVLAVDSIQTLVGEEGAAPGGVAQVREATARLLAFAKTTGTATWIVGHVTKEGGLAGPRTLEHMVDAVLLFEGGQLHRLLRCSKNRFGATSEVGVFEMEQGGLREVANPSALFLAERPAGAPGSAVIASSEGSRPLLVEVQALVAAPAGVPRRATLGIDPQRVALLLAVLERRAGLDVLAQDVFVNLAGGVRLDEPAADLGVIAALASAARRRPVEERTLCFGEVGLAGEVRAVARPEARLAEAAKLGFRRCVLPASCRDRLPPIPGIEPIGVRDVAAAIAALLA